MAKPLEVEIVRGARNLTAARGKRARGVEAVDVHGNEADPCGEDAVRFCAVGALIRSAFELTGDGERSHVLGWTIAAGMDRALGLGGEEGDGKGLVLLSDTRGQKAVLGAFDRYLKT